MVEGRAGLDGVSSSQGEVSDADIPFDGADVALTAMLFLARPSRRTRFWRARRGTGGEDTDRYARSAEDVVEDVVEAEVDPLAEVDVLLELRPVVPLPQVSCAAEHLLHARRLDTDARQLVLGVWQ
jgi:hypothetical protein